MKEGARGKVDDCWGVDGRFGGVEYAVHTLDTWNFKFKNSSLPQSEGCIEADFDVDCCLARLGDQGG